MLSLRAEIVVGLLLLALITAAHVATQTIRSQLLRIVWKTSRSPALANAGPVLAPIVTFRRRVVAEAAAAGARAAFGCGIRFSRWGWLGV